LPIARVP